MKKLLLVSSFLLASNFALAAPHSSEIPLIDGPIPHGTTYNLDLQALTQSVKYTVTCNIKDPGNVTNKVIVYAGTSGMGVTVGDIAIDNTSLYYGGQIALTGIYNSFVVTHVTTQGGSMLPPALVIKNADQNDDISIGQCVAVAESSSK